ncbi:MAG TPA: isocitrate lyase/phosphoenolpyruvate mutase family protein [Dongiaceae bacterium]
MASQQKRAAEFRRLHKGPKILVLANCWDAGSARLIESLGARAIATTSAGVAWALGYPDGDALPLDLLIAAVAGITRVIKVPLTIDMEGGYGKTPKAVGAAVGKVIDAGAIGMNIEDGGSSPDLLCRKIEQVKRTAKRKGVDFFVNARTDVYLRELVPPAKRVVETLARAKRYRDAGADGLFVPGAAQPAEIRSITAAAGLPVNLLAWPGLAPAAELQKLGVRRLSAGSAISQVAAATALARAKAFLRDGDSGLVREGAMTYGELNALVTAR